MRIIAGKWGGRRLKSPTGIDTRPTSDRMRESLFSSLHSRIGSFEGLRVLDAFAGSGALGLEALSRGAAFLVMAERDQKACQVIEENLTGLQGTSQNHNGARSVVKDDHFHLYRGDIFKIVPHLANLRIDLAFFDPPYALESENIQRLLLQLAEAKTFSCGALIVVERAKTLQEESLLPDGFVQLDVKTKGDTTLYFARYNL
ncbi:MAG: 16S rRNA (guanine(966)-N(2))-methyltransferase RsmD [Coriobacteriia bacterium]|nr:16S rRNA (guanine(966)-N(2))-methyltransferase RsmD [Coriobacteriia bacterium]